MKTPNWALAVGILMMLFGGCSVHGDIQSINGPKLMELQESIMEGMTETVKKADKAETEIETETDSTENNHAEDSVVSFSNSNNEVLYDEITQNMKKMFHVSEFTKVWMVRFGYMGLFVSFIYILGGLFLLIKKSFSLKLAYIALGLSILFSIIKVVVLSADSTGLFFAMATGFSQIFGVIIDIVLLIVIAVSDKQAYQFSRQPQL